MTTASTARFCAVICAIALATGSAACGNDDNGGGGGNAAADAGQTDGGQSSVDASRTASGRTATDEDQIKAVAARAEEAFRTGDGEAVCDGLTRAGQQDIVSYGKLMGLSGTCATVIANAVERSKDAGYKQPASRLVAVRVNGTRATALIRITGAGTLRQRYRKIDGQWKLLSYRLAEAVSGKVPGKS